MVRWLYYKGCRKVTRSKFRWKTSMRLKVFGVAAKAKVREKSAMQDLRPYLFSFIKWMSHHSSSFLSHRAGGQLGHHLLPWTNQSLKTIYYPLRIVLKFFLYAILAVKVQILTMPYLECYNSHPFSLITPSIPSFLCCKSNCSKTELWPCTFLWRGRITGKNLGWEM